MSNEFRVNSSYIKKCQNFKTRLLGMMFKLETKLIYLFPKCNSIHTFFMLQNIDVIMLNKDFKVLYIFKNVKPNRIILPKKEVYYTLETSSSNTYFKDININSKLVLFD